MNTQQFLHYLKSGITPDHKAAQQIIPQTASSGSSKMSTKFSFSSFGHALASGLHDFLVADRAIVKFDGKVAADAPEIESITALVPGYGAPAVAIERVALGVLGTAAAALQDADAAATANGINITLDAEVVADIKAIIAAFPSIVATAKAAIAAK